MSKPKMEWFTNDKDISSYQYLIEWCDKIISFKWSANSNLSTLFNSQKKIKKNKNVKKMNYKAY